MNIEAVDTSSAYQNISRVPTSDYSRPGVGSSMPPVPSGADMADSEQNSEQRGSESQIELIQDITDSGAVKSSRTNGAQSEECSNCTIYSERVSAMGQTDFSDGTGQIIADIDLPEVEVAAGGEGVAVEANSDEGPDGLSEEDRREVQQLRQTDQEVRQHEQSHVAAGGPYVRGGPRYEYTYGPDGRRYAVGGSVDIDTSEESEPEQTEKKMRQVRAAAMAPANPSPADHRVAQKASQKESEARMEKMEQEREEDEGAAAETAFEDSETPASSETNIYGNQESEEGNETTIADASQASSVAVARAAQLGELVEPMAESELNILV